MPVPCENPAERIVEALANVPAALAADPAHEAARPRSAGGGQLPPASGIAEHLTERLDELFFLFLAAAWTELPRSAWAMRVSIGIERGGVAERARHVSASRNDPRLPRDTAMNFCENGSLNASAKR